MKISFMAPSLYKTASLLWNKIRDREMHSFLTAQLHRISTSDFLRKVTETFATRTLLLGIGMFTSILISRSLGPEGRGQYAVILVVAGIGIQFGNLGLHASNTYYVAQKRQLLSSLFINSLWVSFGLGSVGAFLAWIFFSIRPDLSPLQGLPLILALVSIPFGLAYLLMQQLLVGIQDIRTYNLVELFIKFLNVSLCGIVIAAHLTRVETIYIPSLLALFMGCLWIVKKLKLNFTVPARPSLPLFKENIQYGFKAYTAAFFSFLALKVSLLMVNSSLGAEQAGYYSISTTMADLVYMLPVVIGIILFPKLTEMENKVIKWNLANQIIFLTAGIMIPVILIAALFAKPVVNILYGAEFLPAVPAFLWLMPAIFLLSVNTIYMNYFASIGMPLITVYSPATAALLNISLNMLMIPRWGLRGAAIASIFSYGTMLLLSILYISRHKKRSIGDEPSSSL